MTWVPPSWWPLYGLLLDQADGLRFGICVCGRPFEAHGRRRVPSSPLWDFACAFTVSGRFESQTRRVYWDPNFGIRARAI